MNTNPIIGLVLMVNEMCGSEIFLTMMAFMDTGAAFVFFIQKKVTGLPMILVGGAIMFLLDYMVFSSEIFVLGILCLHIGAFVVLTGYYQNKKLEEHMEQQN